MNWSRPKINQKGGFSGYKFSYVELRLFSVYQLTQVPYPLPHQYSKRIQKVKKLLQNFTLGNQNSTHVWHEVMLFYRYTYEETTKTKLGNLVAPTQLHERPLLKK